MAYFSLKENKSFSFVFKVSFSAALLEFSFFVFSPRVIKSSFNLAK